MNHILILSLWLNINFFQAQTKPLCTYISQTLFNSVPTKDKTGFTYKQAVKVEGRYRFIFYSDRIILSAIQSDILLIDKIDNSRKPSEVKYFVHDDQNKHFLIALHTGKTNNKAYNDIDYFVIDENGMFTSLSKVICKKLR